MLQNFELLYLETVNLAMLSREPRQQQALMKAAESYRRLLILDGTRRH